MSPNDEVSDNIREIHAQGVTAAGTSMPSRAQQATTTDDPIACVLSIAPHEAMPDQHACSATTWAHQELRAQQHVVELTTLSDEHGWLWELHRVGSGELRTRCHVGRDRRDDRGATRGRGGGSTQPSSGCRLGRDYERISGRNGLLSTIKRRPVTLSWDSNQKTFVFNEEAAKNWTANPGPYQDREVGRAYQSLNMAAAHVASLGMLSGGSVVTGALMGGATSASGTALNGGSQREVLAASTGGALAGGLSALSGGGFTREFQLNTAFTALGLVVEDLINGNEIDPMKVALKSVVGGTLSAGGSWAGKQVDQEGLSQLLESGLAGGGLAEVTDPVSDGLVDMAREALGTADARTDVTPPENLMCEPEPPISLEP